VVGPQLLVAHGGQLGETGMRRRVQVRVQRPVDLLAQERLGVPLVLHGDEQQHRVHQHRVGGRRLPAEPRRGQRLDPAVDESQHRRHDRTVQRQPPGDPRVLAQHDAQLVQLRPQPVAPRHRGIDLRHGADHVVHHRTGDRVAITDVVVDDRRPALQLPAQLPDRPEVQAVLAGQLYRGRDDLLGVQRRLVAQDTRSPRRPLGAHDHASLQGFPSTI
jgi:hypothetical protein